MTFASAAALPPSAICRQCGAEKPLAQMVVLRQRGTGRLRVRPRCKDCHNARERGHRREWKRNYLRGWRALHPDLDRQYYQAAAERNEARLRQQRLSRFRRDHAAYLIQGRLRKRGILCPLAEARELLREYGPAYPLVCGLNRAGRREAERLRSQARRRGRPFRRRDILRALWEREEFRVPRRLQRVVNKRNWRALDPIMRVPMEAQRAS